MLEVVAATFKHVATLQDSSPESLVGAAFWGRGWGQQLFNFQSRRFIERPRPLHWIAFPVDIFTKPLIDWMPLPFALKTRFLPEVRAACRCPRSRYKYLLQREGALPSPPPSFCALGRLTVEMWYPATPLWWTSLIHQVISCCLLSRTNG